MLYEMDGVEANNMNVLIIAATNAPWDVDPALRRSGRFSKTIFIPAPDYESRVAMLKMYAKKRPLAPLIPFSLLGIAATGYASADMKAVVDDAATIPWRQAFMGIEKRITELTKGGMAKEQAEEIAKKQVAQRSVTLGDFVTALGKKRSSLPPWYEQAKKQIGKQEEITMVDGKEHKKVTDSKMGPGEKEAFKDLLGIINNRSQWHYKAYLFVVKHASLMILRVVVFITEGARIS
jgi:SpoVK/Ycf46/Vps4 family AAA+-type ATPase